MEYALAVVGLALVVALVVAAPLRRRHALAATDEGRREALEAAKEAKYREIRDAELDLRMGKLSEADFTATDAELRDQAMLILEQLDRLEPEGGAGAPISSARPPDLGVREDRPPLDEEART